MSLSSVCRIYMYCYGFSVYILLQNYWKNLDQTHSWWECGGVVVEHRTLNREAYVLSPLVARCCVFEQDIFTQQSTGKKPGSGGCIPA